MDNTQKKSPNENRHPNNSSAAPSGFAVSGEFKPTPTASTSSLPAEASTTSPSTLSAEAPASPSREFQLSDIDRLSEILTEKLIGNGIFRHLTSPSK